MGFFMVAISIFTISHWPLCTPETGDWGNDNNCSLQQKHCKLKSFVMVQNNGNVCYVCYVCDVFKFRNVNNVNVFCSKYNPLEPFTLDIMGVYRGSSIIWSIFSYISRTVTIKMLKLVWHLKPLKV